MKEKEIISVLKKELKKEKLNLESIEISYQVYENEEMVIIECRINNGNYKKILEKSVIIDNNIRKIFGDNVYVILIPSKRGG